MTFPSGPSKSTFSMSQNGGGNFNSLKKLNRSTPTYALQSKGSTFNNNLSKSNAILSLPKKTLSDLSGSRLINRTALNPSFGSGHGNSSSTRIITNKISGLTNKLPKGLIIDPGIGNGSPPSNGDHDHHDHHDHHHHHAHGHHDGHGHGTHHKYCHWGPWVIGIGLPAFASYPTYPYPLGSVTTVLTPQVGGPQLVEGVNLQLVDVRLVDGGDPAKNLGPRFRIVVGNRGKLAAGNFQVLAIAAKDQDLTPELPSTMVDVERISPGQVAKVDVRLPVAAMTMVDGNPFNLLAVIVDSNKLIDETSEEDNAGATERTTIERVDSR